MISKRRNRGFLRDLYYLQVEEVDKYIPVLEIPFMKRRSNLKRDFLPIRFFPSIQNILTQLRCIHNYFMRSRYLDL